MKRAAALAVLLIGLGLVFACHEQSRPTSALRAADATPGRPQVHSLGNLRCGRTPTSTEASLSQFFFGSPPQGPMLAVKPVGLLVDAERILIADMGRRAVLQWNAATAALSGAALRPSPSNPVALSAAPDGGVLITDGDGGRVAQYDAGEQLVRGFEMGGGFRPVDAVVVGDRLWVTNSARHCVELFDLGSGAHVRTIGRRGAGRGEFGFPLGIAADAAGSVYVVDMLNSRVQVFDSSGNWRTQIGGPGAKVGAFGRPKDVAVGPDGIVFVSDAATQRVHAFGSDGTPLLAFGSPDEGPGGLWLPNSIAISRGPVSAGRELPSGFAASYYVLVTEQMFDAGVRVFAWRSPGPLSRPATVESRGARKTAAKVASPHWAATGCSVCHGSGTAQSIPHGEVNDLCLKCHDGVQAVSDPHPIAIPAVGEHAQTPASWPTHEGRLGCLTCHDIARHCAPGAVRPAANPGFVRAYEASKPLEFCTNCHNASQAERLNPHRSASGEACRVCHQNPEALPRDGQRRGAAGLNDGSSRGCLRCHTEHWDYAPTGHLGKSLDVKHVQRLTERGAAYPLSAGAIACYTCHNPHPVGTFPRGSILERRAASGGDAALLLRGEQREFCGDCHAP